MAGTFVFASNLPTPSASLLLEGLGFTLLATGVVCVVPVGFAALTSSKPAAIIALIGWQVVASPLIASISSLGRYPRLGAQPGARALQPCALDGGRRDRDDVAGHGHARAGRVARGVPRARRLAHAHDGRVKLISDAGLSDYL